MKRLVMQKDVLSDAERVTTYVYGEFGRMVEMTDPLGVTTVYTYDELGRKTSETNAQGETTRYSYDIQGRLTALENANNGFTYFEYDRSGRLLKEARPMGQANVYTYDAAGNMATKLDANGRRTVYSYDFNNRLVKTEVFDKVSDATPAKTTTYSYNKVGSLTGYDDGVTSAVYDYNDLQQRIGETTDHGAFSLAHGYRYYANGKKKIFTDPAGQTTTWSYDQAGRPLAVDLGPEGVVSINGYQWNRPLVITLPGGSTLEYAYNSLQQVTAITGKDPASNPVMDLGYSYSASGQVIGKTTLDGTYHYGYDQADRLTDVQVPQAAEDENYSYDCPRQSAEINGC